MTHNLKAGDRVVCVSPSIWEGVKGTFVEYDAGFARFDPDKNSVYADGEPVRFKFNVGMWPNDLELDTSFTANLNPIRIESNSQVEQARIVREALREASKVDLYVNGMGRAATEASDEALCKLARLLK